MEFQVTCTVKRPKVYDSDLEDDVIEWIGFSKTDDPSEKFFAPVAYVVGRILKDDKFYVSSGTDRTYLFVNRTAGNRLFVQTRGDSTPLNNLDLLPACDFGGKAVVAREPEDGDPDPLAVKTAPAVADLLKYIIPALIAGGLIGAIFYHCFTDPCSRIGQCPGYILKDSACNECLKDSTKRDSVCKTCPATPCPVFDLLTETSYIYFNFNKWMLKDTAYIPAEPSNGRTLKACLDLLHSDPKLYLDIRGHTDDKGTYRYNHKLSVDREKTIRSYLIANMTNKSDSARILTSQGLGKHYPLIKGIDEPARTRNRRVEIRIYQTNRKPI